MHIVERGVSMPLVLMYHSIADCRPDPFGVTVTLDRFTEHMTWLRSQGLRGVSLGEMEEARRKNRATGLVGLTFDDGYLDFLENAVPVLQLHDFTASVFVIAGMLGRVNEWDSGGPVKRLM